jgi:predicted Zn-dependent peptidase
MIQGITLDDVKQAAQKYFTQFIQVTTGPAKPATPP